jgi:hypothetical protein
MSDDVALLRSCGEALYGPEWQRALARGLGPRHPDGARESIDDRGVRRVAAGQRPIPAWWWSAIEAMLAARMATMRDERRRAAELRRQAEARSRSDAHEA